MVAFGAFESEQKTQALILLDLCHRQWGEASIYHRPRRRSVITSKRLYMLMDEGSLTFNADPDEVPLSCGLKDDFELIFQSIF
jgi:hypothetical protein